ncbi:MAG: acetate kinase [Bacilli bacterium]|nr:acetate kinase [Bacilli bacterium]
MKIISINAGSSSLKFRLFEMPEEKELCAGVFERIGLAKSFYTINIKGEKIKKEVDLTNHSQAVNILIEELINLKIVNSMEDIEGVGHRVVHGGDKYATSVIIDNDVMDHVGKVSDLAPIHNPANILGINAFKEILPNVKSVAIFDTAFHQSMPEEAYIYPVPYEWYKDYGIRKYGFHGTSHKYIAKKISELLNNQNLKVISCHLGNGGSITAIDKGKSIDTTMGFTPLAGIPMGTRSGDIDPSIIPYIMHKTNKTIDEVINDLNKNSGFLGVSGVSADSRDIEAGIEEGNERCLLAYNIYIKEIVAVISSYNTLLNGADVICFTAGIGENSIKTRKDIVEKLKPLGVKLDIEKNNVRGKEQLISTTDSKIRCYIVPTDEELMIAQETYDLIK